LKRKGERRHELKKSFNPGGRGSRGKGKREAMHPFPPIDYSSPMTKRRGEEAKRSFKFTQKRGRWTRKKHWEVFFRGGREKKKKRKRGDKKGRSLPLPGATGGVLKKRETCSRVSRSCRPAAGRRKKEGTASVSFFRRRKGALA